MKNDMILMDLNRVSRSIKRIACEISEAHASDARLILFGIGERGFAIARMLAEQLVLFNRTAEAVQLSKKHPGDSIKKLEIPQSEQFVAFVVDDVIFSGQTMFEALTNVAQNFTPVEMHTVALVDRGHRKFPVKAEFYGLKWPTKLDEYVSVKAEKDRIVEVFLTK